MFHRAPADRGIDDKLSCAIVERRDRTLSDKLIPRRFHVYVDPELGDHRLRERGPCRQAALTPISDMILVLD